MVCDNMKINIIIWGSSYLAKDTINIIEKEKKYNISCLYDPTINKKLNVFGYEVFGKNYNLIDIIKQENIEGGIVSIGDNWIRKKEYLYIKKLLPEFNFINAIHPSVIFGKNVKIGSGNIIKSRYS